MNIIRLPIGILIAFAFVGTLRADTTESKLAALIEDSCIHCHDASTETGLNFETLGHDLSDVNTMRTWELIFDRTRTGEMPPASEERPDSQQLDSALSDLEQDLTQASLAKQAKGRVPSRRLTKLELRYTMQDMFSIDADVTSGIPDEVESGSFDTVGANQRISAVHMESYLQAADEALRHAIQRGSNPYRHFGDHADSNFAYLEEWHEKPINLGGSMTRKLKYGTGFALFRDVDYLTQFAYGISATGVYRLKAKVAAYQSSEPVTAKIIVKSLSGGARLAKSIDLPPGEVVTVIVDTHLQSGDIPYLTFDDSATGSQAIFTVGAKNYKGPGLAILSQSVEGPMFETWPPPSTAKLLGADTISDEDLSPPEAIEHIRRVSRKIAPQIFRRPVSDEEVEDFVKLAKPAVEEGRGTINALKVTLRSMLGSPQFLLFTLTPTMPDDYALANRLSFFLWRSMPDEELFRLADEGSLSDPETLAAQVDRMLRDAKSKRFIEDFAGQWLRLHKINATTPDDGLYPEFDELLGNALTQETELFLANLIEENLPASNLIDADFTFLNRRLAEHYGIEGIEGQDFRRVELSANSPRGGVLTQAAILKTTANGTTTSPVTRGNFVLTNFLGTPPSPPPPSVGSIEPDTRGKTTIREILSAHRDTETCNQCHREIDPPGFALESFDPIGGFREHYRASGGERSFGGFTQKLPPRQGPPVDASGVTADGDPFSGIKEFKQHLLNNQEAVVRNFVSQLVIFGTGGEIEFADREVIDDILDQNRGENFPVRDLLHAVVQSRLFRNQ